MPQPQTPTAAIFTRFLISLPIGAVLSVLFWPKRWLLVDATALPGGAEAAPWYYQFLHCSFLPPWNRVYTGSEFCIAVDVRLVVLVPLALAFIIAGVWSMARKNVA